MNRISRAGRMGALVAGLLVFVAISATQAATLVWTGGVDNAWSTPDNWLNAGVPATYSDGDAVVFDDTAFRTNVNISTIVAPGSILFSNSTAKTYYFSNSIITGACSIVKLGAGTVNFGSELTNSFVYTNSMLFSGGTYVSNGVVRFQVGTNGNWDGLYASGGTPIGFGTGPITINAGKFGFRLGFSSSELVLLTNDFNIGTGGGTVDVGRAASANPQNNLGGNINLYGNFNIVGGNMGTGRSNSIYRVMNGTTRVFNSCTAMVEGASFDGRCRGSYEQNITEASPSTTLTIMGGNQNAMVDFSGDNRGLTGGIVLRIPFRSASAAGPSIIVFTSTNAMGGGAFTVCSNAYAGLAFNFTPEVLNRMTFEEGATLGIDSNSSAAVDLSIAGRNIWIGSARGATYTGLLTPVGGAYKLCGGTVGANIPALTLSNTNALAGANALLLGNTNSWHDPGTLILAASNSYSGGTVIFPSRDGLPLLVSAAQGSLGTGPITFNRTVQGDLTLAISAPQTVPNAMIMTGTGGVAGVKLVASNAVSITGVIDWGPRGISNAFTFSGNSNIELKPSNGLAGMTNLFLIGPGDGNNLPAVSIPLGSDLPAEISTKINGGILVLSPQMTWSNFAKLHNFVSIGTAPAIGQWSMNNNNSESFNGGFAAKDAPQVINESIGGFTNLINQVKFMLGSVNTNADGTFYANAPVDIAANLMLGTNYLTAYPNSDRQFTIAVNGPGIALATSNHVIQKISGNMSGPGAPSFTGRGTGTKSNAAEVVLSGLNSWTGGLFLNLSTTYKFSTGPGSLGSGRTANTFVRFKGNSSLPTGNSGAASYLANVQANDNGWQGILLTGVTNGNEVYRLPANYKFVIGGSANANFGSTEGDATLKGSELSAWYQDLRSFGLNLLVRDGSLTLGEVGEPVLLTASYSDPINTNYIGWSSAAASPLIDRLTTNTTTLIKRGAGTLVLKNVEYTQVNGSGEVSTNYVWQLGSGTAYLFDGVVRETGVDKTNSLRQSKFNMNGAIYGLSSDWTVSTGTNAAELNVTSANGYFGFSAYGGNRVMNLRPHISGTTFQYGQTFASASFFLGGASQAIILNDANAEGEITFLASDIDLNLSAANREFMVLSTNYAGRIPALIKNSTGLAGLIKTGPGRLILESSSNTYNGVTAISNGTLTVNGLFTSTTNGITVYSGGTLDGTGTVRRAVTVASGGTLSAGAGANLNGTLTISSNLVMNGTLAVGVSGIGAGQYDVVNVSGSVTLAGTLTVVPASGYEMPGGATIQILTATGGITGSLLPAPRGYSFVQTSTTLSLKRDSPGFIFRIQ